MTKLQSLSVHNCVQLLWIPGHSYIEGNEIADGLAKQAAITDFTGPELVLGGLTVTSVRNTVHPMANSRTDKKNGTVFRVVDKQGSYCKITAPSLQNMQ